MTSRTTSIPNGISPALHHREIQQELRHGMEETSAIRLVAQADTLDQGIDDLHALMPRAGRTPAF